jgi:hypothetical protein
MHRQAYPKPNYKVLDIYLNCKWMQCQELPDFFILRTSVSVPRVRRLSLVVLAATALLLFLV